MKQEITVIPFQGTAIKPQAFQQTTEQPNTQYDIDRVVKKGFQPGIELHTLLDNNMGREILEEICKTHDTHPSKCNFITEQSTRILNMATPQPGATLDYKTALKERNSKMNIPSELNTIKRHQSPSLQPQRH